MSFQSDERQKRIVLAKTLLDKGFTITKIAAYFKIRPETVQEYLRASVGSENSDVVVAKNDKKIDLFSFTQRSVSSDDFFAEQPYKEGFKCIRCKRYSKYEAGKQWSTGLYICIDCYQGLDTEDLLQFKHHKV